ncbi:MAG: ATP synthase F0 subunit B [Proteobacteria bacterium]|nr:ATP synthase F0 subunit B [Pseudomonadota bacterium]MBU4298020.1 ATP synthase F0 subunit B [Pseudomonadota bacterium]MCG2749580.1 ATP synthase F0 subunit B [Desulfobulbaceae bacterium]
MITVDITMLIHVMNILFLIVVLNAVLYRPVRRILAERKQKITDLNTDVDTFNKNAKLRAEQFDQKFRDARRKAKAEFDAARNEAQEAGTEKLQQIKSESDKAKAAQLSTVASEVKAAEQALKGQVGSFATEMAGKVLGRAL